MSRVLSSNMATEFASDTLSPIILVELDFDTDPVNVWSGINEIDWDGITWFGLGDLLGVSFIEETTEVRAIGSTVTLNGLDSSITSVALQEDYQGRSATIWLGALGSNGQVIADPIVIFGGRMDTMAINEGSETVSITINIENRLIDFERSKIRRYTDQDQKIDYPNDKGFEFVSAIRDKEIVWGRT